MRWKRLEIFLELLIFGIILGIVEDLIAVRLITGEHLTWRSVGIVVLVTIPFAIIGEVLIDQIDLVKILRRLFSRHKQ